MFKHFRPWHQIAGFGIVAILACNSSQAESLSTPVSLPAPPGALMLVAPELSADGRSLAFTIFQSQGGWHGSVQIASLANLNTVAVKGGHSAWTSGGFSPDGQFLLVAQLNPPKALLRIPIEGGEGIQVAESGNVGADWGPNNDIVIGSEAGGLRVVSAEGGVPNTVTSLKEGEVGHWLPNFLPGGKAVVFYVFTGDRSTGQVGLYDFDSGTRKTLLRGTKARYSESGHLLFWRDESLWAVLFDPIQLETMGPAVEVLPGLGADSNGDAWFTLSREGTLAYIMEDKWRAIDGTIPEAIISSSWFEILERKLPSPSD